MIGFSKPFLNKAPQHFGFPKIRVSPKVGVASNLFSQSSLVKFLPQSNNLGKSGKYISTTSLGGIIEEKGETAKKFQDNLCPHKRVISFGASPDKGPQFANDTYIAPNAVLVGNVHVMGQSSIWYGCVLRGDVTSVAIGQWTNIQDETVITEALNPLGPDHDGSTIIGHYVTVGHKCLLRACTIEDECLVGMGSVLEEGSYMEHKSMLGAGSVLMKGARVASGELWLGNPAKFFRKLLPEEQEQIFFSARDYWYTARKHAMEFFVPSTLHREVTRLGIPIGWKDL